LSLRLQIIIVRLRFQHHHLRRRNRRRLKNRPRSPRPLIETTFFRGSGSIPLLFVVVHRRHRRNNRR
jgi:hypothetical protein